jgi:hypothetical protein
MFDLEKLLSGGDLRSIGRSGSVISKIKRQCDFDELFGYLFHHDRIVVMRAADAIEKITLTKPEYLKNHAQEIISLCGKAKNKELMWHLAQLLSRLRLDRSEFESSWNILAKWVKDKTNSRIVRVNSLQALFDLLSQDKSLLGDFNLILLELEKENIPSIRARIKMISRKLHEELK